MPGKTQSAYAPFSIRLFVSGAKYSNIVVQKSANRLTDAIAMVFDSLLERFNRHGDKNRIKERRLARQIRDRIDYSANSADEFNDDQAGILSDLKYSITLQISEV